MNGDGSLRVLLYSHDSVGLGHLRRNLAIAWEITRKIQGASVMIVTGSPCATQFQLPPNTDLIKVPCITKNASGDYVTDSFGGSLRTTIDFRGRMILETFRAYAPDLVIVDHQLTGLMGEAMPMLREARRSDTLLFFGMRDVKDSPEVVRRRWNTPDHHWALNECYDQVCVYGIREVFDPRQAYAPLLDGVRRLDFTGFIVSDNRKPARKPVKRKRRKVLVTFGGGVDGAQRAEQYLRALAVGNADWDSYIVTGPMMSNDTIRHLEEQARKVNSAGSITFRRFHRNMPKLLRKADAVVSMAGYNSCAEILQSGVPAVLLPRSFPRQEQLIRAVRLAQLGWVTTMPQPLPDPVHLFEAVESALATPRRFLSPSNLDGVGNLCRIILERVQSREFVRRRSREASLAGRDLWQVGSEQGWGQIASWR